MKLKLLLPLVLFCTVQLAAQTDTAFVETADSLITKTGNIYGTLCTPEKFTKGPVALIIAGSGPTDRNCNSALGLTTDTYKILAHKFAAKGIATLRYDKRGIGESRAAMVKEDSLRFETYIDDAKDWVELLKKDKRFSQVIIIGHSEGSLIGMDVATKDVDRFVSLAGAGQSGDKILKIQLAKLPQMGRDTAYKMLDSLTKGKLVTHVDPMFFNMFRPSVQPYMISWFKHDPQTDIEKLTIPILIIQGTSDLQVDTTDSRRLANAAPKARLINIAGMNHILRDVGNDKDLNLKSYNDPSMPLDKGLINDLVEFIKQK